MNLHGLSLPQQILQLFNISKKQKTQVHSTKYKKAGIVTFLLHITTGVTYEKYATWFLDLVVRLILHW